MADTNSAYRVLCDASAKALEELMTATHECFHNGDPISILTLRTLSQLAARKPDATSLADALLDYADEQLRSSPYKAVTAEHRAAFVQASVLKALALITCASNGHNEKVQRDALCEALKTLDTSLLMAGRAAHEHSVMELIACISNSLEPPTVGADRSSEIRLQLKEDRSPRPIIAFPPPAESTPPSIYGFATRIIASGRRPQPLLMKGAVADWPACSIRPWADLSYLRKAIGAHRTVPIEIGAKYTDSQWTQKLVTVADFLDALITAPDGDMNGRRTQPVAYLAQHDLFSQIPRLKDDILIPDYCFVSVGEDDDDDSADKEVAVNAWFGPRGTVSPLHHDPHNNMFAQVVGSKYIRLYAPEHSAAVYPNEEESMMSNTSRVDVESPDLAAFPDFAAAPYFECVVEPGDLLFIPKGWWHYVRSLSLSFSVSFWY
ncbi:Lysine-specific demethylase 8 [Geranomyces variabilis]|uniref:Lysine-specific demethylase 8 n=1 Tax=Geranomyces variabilis TaxID=109894 RepID=A0AAD5TDC0_9FUNG|nr:Lysine-specific demethylase 8 [Geranomyces variabilis]